jgi:ferredoxin, 2Fe-2S
MHPHPEQPSPPLSNSRNFIMTRLIFRLPDGSAHAVDAANGASVMQAAIHANIRGIEAECGGACACATCHVYVDDASAGLLPLPEPDERDMLEGVAAERRPNSRLACQITISDTMDGLTVQIPDRQY